MRLTSILFGAGAALVVTAGTASAAVVTNPLNLRAGPGTGYRVVDTMPAGARVAVRNCRGSWCRVIWRGEEGYASRHYLTGGRGYAYGAPGYYEPDYEYSYPYYSYYDDYGDYGPGFVFGFGGGHYRYYRHHYRGRHHFAGGGVSDHRRTTVGVGPGPRNQRYIGSVHAGANFGARTGGRVGAHMNATVGAGPSTVGRGGPHVGFSHGGGGHVGFSHGGGGHGAGRGH